MENENLQNYQNNQSRKNNQTYQNGFSDQDYLDNEIFYDNKENISNQADQNSQNNKDPKPPFDSKLAIVMVQIVMCAMIIAVCFVMKSFCGDLFSEMKTWYGTNVEDKTTTDQVLNSSSNPSSTSSNNTSSNSTSSGSSSSVSSSTSSGLTSSNVTSGKKTTSGTSSLSAFVAAEGGPPEVVTNSFSFDAVRQTMAKSGGTGNSLYVPVKGTVSSPFGYRYDPISGAYSYHDGLDIAANTGTEIHAASDGTVETAGNDTYYGNYIVIKHSNNFKTLYGHCSVLKVKAGQTVKAGDVIALVGSTGRSTGPHLHFEVQIGGSKINPTWLLGADFQ